jgi:hypothetical protein
MVTEAGCLSDGCIWHARSQKASAVHKSALETYLQEMPVTFSSPHQASIRS